jgi:hypothetical protein
MGLGAMLEVLGELTPRASSGERCVVLGTSGDFEAFHRWQAARSDCAERSKSDAATQTEGDDAPRTTTESRDRVSAEVQTEAPAAAAAAATAAAVPAGPPSSFRCHGCGHAFALRKTLEMHRRASAACREQPPAARR